MARYVTFLMSARSGQVVEGSASDRPSPRVPEDTDQWKVTCDARGTVAVHGYGVPRPILIGIATRAEGRLTGFRQEQQHTPSDVKWTAIETAIGRELDKLGDGPADDTLVVPISRGERNNLYPRDADWKAMGPRYDRNGVDRYFMRKVKKVVALAVVLMIAGAVAATWITSNRGRNRQPPGSPILEKPDP